MGRLERIYRRTESGASAFRDGDPQLSPEHQRILALLESDTHWDEIRKVLRRHADYQRLSELEAGGYVVSIVGSFAFGS